MSIKYAEVQGESPTSSERGLNLLDIHNYKLYFKEEYFVRIMMIRK
jgi:hypothetical protein